MLCFKKLINAFFQNILGDAEITGATNLMAHYGLEHSYGKFSGKKVKEQLSTFLPNLPGCDGMANMVSLIVSLGFFEFLTFFRRKTVPSEV